MANALGYINETETGFEGNLAMMSLSAPIRIVKNNEKTSEKQPDYRVYAGHARMCWSNPSQPTSPLI